jgi:NADH:ubiquinone oxidoreductase subunit 6 (subunit J)
MEHLAVFIAGVLAVLFASLMVLQRSLYVSAVCLLVVLTQAAALFFFSGAPLLAFLQVMIYAGAVMVLIVVAIMAAPAPAGERFMRLSLPWPLAVAGLLLPILEIFLSVARQGPAPRGLGLTLSVEAAIGPILFGSYAVATEAVTLLLLLSALAIVTDRAIEPGSAASGTRREAADKGQV